MTLTCIRVEPCMRSSPRKTASKHCAHVSLDLVEDPDGKMKCQASEDIVPADLFLADEIAFLDEFCGKSLEVNTSCLRGIENPSPPTNQPSNKFPKKEKKKEFETEKTKPEKIETEKMPKTWKISSKLIVLLNISRNVGSLVCNEACSAILFSSD